jgi:integrase/recombinase XerD
MHPLVEEYGLWQQSGRRAPRTVYEKCRLIQRFLRETNSDPLSTEPMQIARWMAAYPDWGPSTAATYFSYLMAWHKWLVLMGHRTDNPMHKLQTPRLPERSPRPVSDSDLNQLLGSRLKRRTRIMILLAALAGLRVSEIAAVRGEDIDLDANRMFVMGKNGKKAWLPLHPILAEVARTMPRTGWWFPGQSRRRPDHHIRSKSVSDIVGQAMRRAGVGGTPHALRHWYATALLAEGADLRTVQELMRHSSVQTTQVYTKVPDARRSDAVGKLDPYRAA